MYSASAQSTVLFLVMSARPRRIRERPGGGKGQPEGCRSLATSPGTAVVPGPHARCVHIHCVPSPQARGLAGRRGPSSSPTTPANVLGWPRVCSHCLCPCGREEVPLAERQPRARATHAEQGTLLQ